MPEFVRRRHRARQIAKLHTAQNTRAYPLHRRVSASVPSTAPALSCLEVPRIRAHTHQGGVQHAVCGEIFQHLSPTRQKFSVEQRRHLASTKGNISWGKDRPDHVYAGRSLPYAIPGLVMHKSKVAIARATRTFASPNFAASIALSTWCMSHIFEPFLARRTSAPLDHNAFPFE